MRKYLAIGLLVTGLVALFLVRVQFLFEYEKANQVLMGEQTIEGVITNDPDGIHIVVDHVLITAWGDFSYGDRVVIRGKIEEPQAFETDTGRMFDYPSYLRAQGIYGVMHGGEVVSVEEGSWSVRRALYAVKHAFEHSLERLIPSPESSLLEGILLGEKKGLPESLTQAFVIASLIHVVVLSGYNITIIADAALRSMRKLPRKASYSIGAVLMIFFVVMTGAGAASVRACIMALVAILARYLKRPTIALRTLAFAAGAMMFWNPLAIIDPSLILSVLATLGLILLSPTVEHRIGKFFRSHSQIRSITASTISVQLFLLPALLYMSGILSFVALPANLLVLPIIPFTMGVGFISGLIGLVLPAVAFVPALITDMVLRYEIFIAHAASTIPFSYVVIPSFSLWITLLIYIPVTSISYYVYIKNSIWQPKEGSPLGKNL